MSITWNDVMKFDLPENPIIFDVGGYKGDWVKIALDKYKNPTIYVFEPVKSFYEQIVERWKSNPNIKVFNFGLSDKNREEEICIDGDSSSVFRGVGNFEKIQLKDIREFIVENELMFVDLIKINIEGEEYRLLEYLTSIPELNVFQNYLVQFHGFVENYEIRREDIIKKISEYYDKVVNFDMVFEGWTIKKIKKTYCYGDSHISIFSNKEDLIKENNYFTSNSFTSYRFGPYLAYNLPEKNDVLSVINSSEESDNVLICFGEIDCRAQVKRICEKSDRDYKDVINEIVNRYFSVIEKIVNKNMIVFSITPEIKEQPHWYYYKDRPEVFDCPKGTLLERSSFKEYFNNLVISECEKRGYKYFSIYDTILKGDIPAEFYYMDDIHLNPRKVFYLIEREFIKNKITI